MRFVRIEGLGLVPPLVLLAAGFLAGGRLGAVIVAVSAVAALLALGAVFAAGMTPRTSLRRALPDHPATAGDSVEITLEGDIALAWPLALARLADEPTPPLDAGPPGEWRLGGRLHQRYSITDIPRGLYSFRHCEVALQDALGLVQRRLRVDLPGSLLVYPRRIEVPLGRRETRAQSDQEVVRGTRDFLPGDRLTRLHAARTDQRGYPQVRESTPPPARTCSLQLQCPGASREDVELAISVAASLAESLLAAGFDVGVAAEGVSLPPGHGQDHLVHILAALAEADARRIAATSLPPPLPDAYGELWLIAAGAAALRVEPPQFAVLVAVGTDLKQPAIATLADLVAWAGRWAP